MFKTNVAKEGYEIIEIIAHGALCIPNNYIKLSKSYIKCRSKYSIKNKQSDNYLNTTKPIEGTNPVWNQPMLIETSENEINKEELSLLLIDDVHRMTLAEYKIPWNILKPFYQYNLEMIMNKSAKKTLTGNEIKLYVSLIRKPYRLNKNENGIFGFEILLNDFNAMLKEKMSLYAVARIVPDQEIYEEILFKNNEKNIDFKKVVFSTPTTKVFQQSFQPIEYKLKGYPQITFACKTSKILNWQQNFFFATDEEKKSIFSNKSALFIEFYFYEKIGEKFWKINQLDLFGWCKLKFDEKRKHLLLNDDVGLGFKSDLKLMEINETLVVPSSYGNKIIQTALRFAKNEQHLHKQLNMAEIDNLYKPSESFNENEKFIEEKVESFNENEKFIEEKVEINEKNTVEANRNNTIIVEPAIAKETNRTDFYDLYLTKPLKETGRYENDYKKIDKNRILSYRDDLSDIPPEYKYAFVNSKLPSTTDIDGILYYYYDLLLKYRGLVRKMDDDTDLLKKQIRTTEQVNYQLTNRMANFAEKKIALLKLSELNEVDRLTMNKSFIELRARLAIKAEENFNLKNEVARLQKLLEKKRVTEDEVARIAEIHNSQNRDLAEMQHRLAKAYGLEDTVKRQEMIIEKLETLIQNLVSSGNSNFILSDE